MYNMPLSAQKIVGIRGFHVDILVMINKLNINELDVGER